MIPPPLSTIRQRLEMFARPMIADDIIEAVARHRRIKPAVEELIEQAKTLPGPRATSIASEHTFVCEVDGQKYDVKISLEVAGQKKH
jgi:hypothetical protein